MVDVFVGVGRAAKVVGPDIVIDLADLPLTQCGFLFELLKNPPERPSRAHDHSDSLTAQASEALSIDGPTAAAN